MHDADNFMDSPFPACGDEPGCLWYAQEAAGSLPRVRG